MALVPCDGLGANPCTLTSFIQLFVNIYNLLLGLAAIIAVLMLVMAGVRMLVYYWDESPESELEKAKLTIRRAIFGIIIIVAAYLLVNTLLKILGAGDINTFIQTLGG